MINTLLQNDQKSTRLPTVLQMLEKSRGVGNNVYICVGTKASVLPSVYAWVQPSVTQSVIASVNYRRYYRRHYRRLYPRLYRRLQGRFTEANFFGIMVCLGSHGAQTNHYAKKMSTYINCTQVIFIKKMTKTQTLVQKSLHSIDCIYITKPCPDYSKITKCVAICERHNKMTIQIRRHMRTS